MVKINEEMKKILDVREEDDEKIIDNLKSLSKDEKDAFVAIIAPYVGVKITPSKMASAQIGLSEEFGIETVIENIKECNEGCENLYLLLNSPGGLVQSSYKIARALRNNFKNIIVFIPHIAASGGTLVALIGNEIVMGMMSQLTPLDPHNSDGTSALSIKRGFELVTELFRQVSVEDAPYTYKVLADKYNAVQLDSSMASMELIKKYIREILEGSKYKKNEINSICEILVEGFLTHEDVITYKIAKEIGLKVCMNTKYPEFWNIFRQWLSEYILESADKHIIRYYIPNKKTKETKGKKKRVKKR